MPDFQFDSIQTFFAMGGYASFVWISYGAFALCMGWVLIQPRLERRRILQLLKARSRRESARKNSSAEVSQTKGGARC